MAREEKMKERQNWEEEKTLGKKKHTKIVE